MANKNTAGVKAANSSLITTNGVGDISGADVNSMFVDVADSFTNKNKAQTALASNATTWDVGGYDEANANVAITLTTHTINITNINTSGNYSLLVIKNTASDVTLTITSTVAVVNINSNVLSGPSGGAFMVHLKMRGSLYAEFSQSKYMIAGLRS